MDRYASNQKGVSPALSAILNEFKKMPRSSFDETRRKSFDVDPFAIIPVECFPLYPNSDVDVTYDISVLSKTPLVKRLMSGMSLELRVYRINNNDLWRGWNNFITHGRTGKVTKSIPYVDFISTTEHADYTTLLPHSPAFYLEMSPPPFIAQQYLNNKFVPNLGFKENSDFRACVINDDSGDFPEVQLSGMTGHSDVESAISHIRSGGMKVSALPFVFYNKIAKEFMNSNLMQGNPHWFPEDEDDDFILPYDCEHAITSDYYNPNVSYTGVTQPSVSEDSYPWLNVIWYKQRQGDYFSTSSPFPDLLRGDIPTMSLLSGQITSEQLNRLLVGDTPLNYTGDGTHPFMDATSVTSFNVTTDARTSGSVFQIQSNSTSGSTYSATNTRFKDFLLYSFKVPFTDIFSGNLSLPSQSIYLSDLRQLITLTLFKERLARTDGSYNQMVQAMFGHNPNWHIHQPTYCGGHYQRILFDEVVQTSADNEASPLGSSGSRAISANQSKSIHIHSGDFGMFMTVLTLTPDNYYSQGISRLWSQLDQAEQYFPILNNLSPQAVKNKELFVSGSLSTDEDVFAYQERYSEIKSRRNAVAGMMALPISKVGDTGAYVMQQIFKSTPQFNQSFVQGEMTDNEKLVFSELGQSKFTVTVASMMRFTGPFPAVQQASDFGFSY